MRSSYDCESNCAPPLCCLPCFPKSKEDASSDPVPGSPSTGAGTPLVQKVEATAAAGDDDEECCKVIPVAPKSSLKKAHCVDRKNAVKGNVKWMDLLGKDLTQVKEFEPRYVTFSLLVLLSLNLG
jgi:hypothetical protein